MTHKIKVPYGRGFRIKCDPWNGPRPLPLGPTKANDFFLHTIMGRVAGNNGATHELNTYYDQESGTLEMCIPEDFLQVIENVAVGPNLQRFLQWLNTSAGPAGQCGFNFVSDTTVLDDTYALIECDATAGPFNLDLPPAAGRPGRTYFIKKTDPTANVISIIPDGADKIDNNLQYLLELPYEFVSISANGVDKWLVICANSLNNSLQQTYPQWPVH